MKKKIIIPIIIILLPVIFYLSIVIANNTIANNIERSLKLTPLPTKTEIVDSVSIAGKISGNGNGMQYLGAILISSELNQNDLEYYYKSFTNDICLEKQENAKILPDSIHGEYEFSSIDAEKNNYIVYLWGGVESDFLSSILNLDLRAH